LNFNYRIYNTVKEPSDTTEALSISRVLTPKDKSRDRTLNLSMFAYHQTILLINEVTITDKNSKSDIINLLSS